MSASVLDENRLTLSQAAKLLPGRDGEPVTRQTLRRWCVAGVTVNGHRVKLDARRVASTWFTSREAVERFLAALNPAAPEPARTPAASTRASKRAERELIRRGV